MKLDLKWGIDGEETSGKEAAIVVDVLRASTSIVTALSLGAKEVLPFIRVEDALAHKGDAILMGERGREKISGFDFGNSPSQLDGRLCGKTIAFTSTNFPKALAAAKRSPHTLIGALVNLSHVCDKAHAVALEKGLDLCLLLAGQSIEPHATEELVFAGLCGQHLRGRCEPSERVLQAMDFLQKNGPDISRGKHAIELIEHGFSEDVKFANRKDIFNIAPAFKDGRISLWI